LIGLFLKLTPITHIEVRVLNCGKPKSYSMENVPTTCG